MKKSDLITLLALLLISACGESTSIVDQAKSGMEAKGHYTGPKFNGYYVYKGELHLRYDGECDDLEQTYIELVPSNSTNIELNTEENSIFIKEVEFSISLINVNGSMRKSATTSSINGPVEPDGRVTLYAYDEDLDGSGQVEEINASIGHGRFEEQNNQMFLSLDYVSEVCHVKDGQRQCCTVENLNPIKYVRT